MYLLLHHDDDDETGDDDDDDYTAEGMSFHWQRLVFFHFNCLSEIEVFASV